MNKISSYVSSLIFSILLVLSLTASIGMLIVDINVTPEKAVDLSRKEDLASKCLTQIEKYFREQSNATGVPAEVYTEPLTIGYINKVIEETYIKNVFDNIKKEEKVDPFPPVNPDLDDSIDKFFNDYADKIGYEKDDAFYEKLESAKSNAYKVIGNNCDVYKAKSLSKHGVVSKVSKLYKLRPVLTFASIAATVIMLFFIIAVNWKNKKLSLYWIGISSIISGIIGTVPSVYLIVTKYFDSFSIKQPQVFKAYTGAMYKLTAAFMAVSIAIAVVGIALVVLYAVFCSKDKHSDETAPVLPADEK
ncbi:MAG: hypothetical protein IKS13_09785 [Ruminococcus sp.]|nr:hypothetical protein [Ruminococcus sp.]